MARARKEREIQVIHFSFFDLLFGAFGAFVFLMIMHVLSTMNMVDMDFQKAFDRLAEEKKALAHEVDRLKESDAQRQSIEEKYKSIRGEKDAFAGENRALKEKAAGQEARMDALEEALKSRDAQLDKVRGKDEVIAAAEEENKKLKKELAELKQKMSMLEPKPLKIKSLTIKSLIAGQAVSLPLAAEGGVPPYTWELSGKLPEGLTLDEKGGTIAGTTKGTGIYTFSLKVKDSSGLSTTIPAPASIELVRRPEERKEGVSKGFVVMSVVVSLLLLYILWGKYQSVQYFRKMVAQGYKAIWVKDT
jgi:hypothetical protein